MTPEKAFKRLMDSIDVYDESLNLTDNEMLDLGMRRWANELSEGKETGKSLWLFPLSFYAYIPAGFPIVDLNFKREVFQPHITDKDDCFGLLAFGVLGKTKSLTE